MSETKERRTVHVDLNTLKVYPEHDGASSRHIGVVTEYVHNEGARIRTRKGMSTPFSSHRITVKFSGDVRSWVGQFRNEEMTRTASRKSIILRPVPVVMKGLTPDLIITDEASL